MKYYVFNEEEFKAIVGTVQKQRRELQDTLQDLCSRVSNHEPIPQGRVKLRQHPWGCGFSRGKEPLCDLCPVRDVCPCECKHFSGEG